MSGHGKIIHLEQIGETLIVAPQGDASQFRSIEFYMEVNRFYECLAKIDSANLVFDLGKMQMLGSMAIGLIMRSVREITCAGGQAVICAASQTIEEKLRIMNVYHFCLSARSREEALEVLRQSAISC